MTEPTEQVRPSRGREYWEAKRKAIRDYNDEYLPVDYEVDQEGMGGPENVYEVEE